MKIEIQRICVKAKPTESNHDYYDWQTASIVMFIPENNKSTTLKKARNELQKRHWEFINYEDKSTLIKERVKKGGGEVWDAYPKLWCHILINALIDICLRRCY